MRRSLSEAEKIFLSKATKVYCVVPIFFATTFILLRMRHRRLFSRRLKNLINFATLRNLSVGFGVQFHQQLNESSYCVLKINLVLLTFLVSSITIKLIIRLANRCLYVFKLPVKMYLH
jgi:hypothetical protein